MDAVTKTGNALTNFPASALPVNIAIDTVAFQLQSCNVAAPAAPAYSVFLADVLATQLDENSITALTVTINGIVGTAGVDYIYTPPGGRGGTLQFELLTAVNPGQCVTINYDIGFYTDFGPNETWNNSVTVNEYWSLPAGSGQQYLPVGTAQFYMINQVDIEPLSKILTSPASEITIGEDAIYTITVPAVPVNAVLNNVIVNDTLDVVLEYQGATAVDGGGLPVILVDTTVGQDVVLSIASIPAGEQVIITLQTRLANNASSNAGVSFTNTAVYSYTGIPGGAITGSTSDPLLIIEPTTAIAKVVNPNTPPNAGDVLTYSLTFTASGGAVGDNFSDVYDLRIDDSLTLGLAYVPGSATVDGAGNTITDPVVSGDGISAAQTLLWRLEDATADIDIVEGTVVTVSYDVVVLDNVLAGQDLSNSASSQWTGIDEAIGDPANLNERNGSATPAENDYFNGPVIATLTTLDNTTLIKTRLTDTYDVADANVRVGDLVDYELRIHLDEGSHSGLIINDVLPLGLQFEQVVSINGDAAAPYSSVTPFTHNDIATPVVAGNAALAATTVTWAIGDVVNVGDNNAANDDFVIIYRARLLNNDVFLQVNSTGLTNTATLDYVIAGGAAASQLDTEDITLLQPDLAVTKAVATTGGDTVIDAGELITYTVDVINSGAAPAYDSVIQDILPVGLRQGGITSTTISLVVSGTALPSLAPSYDPVTGIAIWNLDSGGADIYTIPVGETLRIVYTVLADADLGPNQTMINAVTATDYYSFDNEVVPVNGNATDREHYGPTNTATTTLTTPLPAALLKATTQPTAAIGEQFTYRITVPATPQTTALNDVRILDDLTASTAAMTFVAVTKVSPTGTWVPVNTGTAKNLVIEDLTNGIDIPAGEQAIIEITVELDNTIPPNSSGTIFTNTADYTYNVTNDSGQPGTSGNMTIVGPDTVTLEKTGPATIRLGLPETFTINVQNTGTATAWDLTITDQLPNPVPGGMCDAAPTNITAQIFQTDGTTPVSAVLTQGVDYITSFSGGPACTFTITMQSVAAAINAGERLIVNYDATLDLDSIGGTSLTNVAAATEWFSGDTVGAGASGEIRTYTGTLSDGTVGTLDEQDAHTLTVDTPVLVFEKRVVNVTTGQDPGTSAQPGHTLRYTLYVENSGPSIVPDFSLIDELDALNEISGTPAPVFVAGSLNIISAPVGADTSNTNPNGGSNGTGLVDIRNLSLAANDGAPGGADTVEVVFEVTLLPVIDGGRVVLNQASLDTYGIIIEISDDPNVTGAQNATETLITSAPLFQVQKTSQDISGDPNLLLAGDRLRYTITVKNIGQEDAINTLLTDQIPANTSYVADSTTLNGQPVGQPDGGVSPLESGLPINAPGNINAGAMEADSDPAANNVATITFEVEVNASVIDGTVISNQGFVSGDGAGSGTFPQQPSDDPATAAIDDPTIDIVGSVALFDVQKTVAIVVDNGTPGIVDQGDTLRYTITATNFSSVPVTNAVLTDDVPVLTQYVANSTTLNGLAVADPAVNVSPLITGIDISSSDLTPPLPTVGAGILSPGQSAVVEFEVTVDAAAQANDPISNQGFVSSNELPVEPTDNDGIDSNGDDPTVVTVGAAPSILITKQVFVVGSGEALADGVLEYVVQVTNTGVVPVTNVVITDIIDPATTQMTYVDNSALLNGLSTGTSWDDIGKILTADYSTTYGNLAPAEIVELRFRVTLDGGLNIGDTVTNRADVSWNVPVSTAFAEVSIAIGGIPGAANLNGQVWHDADFSNDAGAGESMLQGWTVNLYSNNILLATTLSGADGSFQFSGVAPNIPAGSSYELRYIAPGAVATTATLGNAHAANADPTFTVEPQRINDIFVASGASVQNLNMPIQPNGVVYNSVVLSEVVADVRLTMINQTQSAQQVPARCFDDPTHAAQVTTLNGFYKFDLNFSDPLCNRGDEYEIVVQPLSDNFVGTTSVSIPPVAGTQDVISCTGDQVPATVQCENSVSEQQPVVFAAANYYLNFRFNDVPLPSRDQIFNNHIPVDPDLGDAVAISKVAGLQNVTRSQLVPYTITITNTLQGLLRNINLIDAFPAGFQYVRNSARRDGIEVEPQINGNQLTWGMPDLVPGAEHTIKLLLIVGSGVSEGEYVNNAYLIGTDFINTETNGAASGVASATVRVIPDPTFDCTDIIGKVFDDKNMNAYQDEGETGLPGVQVATARGLRVTTDQHGRFHITCAVVPHEVRGSNFIMKLDDRTLPSGYRITTENPRVQRATRGKMMKFNFGAVIHRVVRLDLADGVFEKGSTELRPQWRSRIETLIIELQKDASILRLSYLGENETEAEVEDRLDAIEALISDRWEEIDCCYKLTIETEVFWRKGNPSDRKEFE